MNYDRSLIFAYLEEDNIQRAYFRVRPLLTMDGDVREEAVKLWPNEGGLRIVPDRNEQHTFKTRMRSLGSYCVVDLRNQPPEAGKIRTNKNFRPDKGEVNQYILYSDTVHELPEDTFFQLLDGSAADYEELASKAITPRFYIRAEDTLYGPVCKASPAAPDTAGEAAGMLYEIPCPDGVTRQMLCMHIVASADVAAEDNAGTVAPQVTETAPHVAVETEKQSDETHVEDALPIGESLQILDENTSHEDTLKQLDQPVSAKANLLKEAPAATSSVAPALQKDEPLSGTPLIRATLHMSVQQTKNRTQEIVSNQCTVGKYEPPVQSLPSGMAMRGVENPVETACYYWRAAWDQETAHDQLTDFILSLAGARNELSAKLCKGSSDTLMQRVLRERLQDLEAERLTALCELDKAKRDVDAYKQELLTALSNRLSKETNQLKTDKAACEALVAQLKTEINALTLQRDAMLDQVRELQSDVLPEAAAKLMAQYQMSAQVNGVPLRMSPVSGQHTAPEATIQRLMDACAASGVPIQRNQAIAILVLLAISPRIGLACSTPAAAATLLHNVACAFGWQNSYAHQYTPEQRPLVGIRPVDAVPAILSTSLPNYAPVTGATKVTMSRNTGILVRNAAYDVAQWPILSLPALPFVPAAVFDGAAPVSAASIAELAAASDVRKDEMETVFAPILKVVTPLGGAAYKEMLRFTAICAGLMEGGLPAAVDWAILLWIIPGLEAGGKPCTALKSLLDEYPLSRNRL